jgi:hypothetical protein
VTATSRRWMGRRERRRRAGSMAATEVGDGDDGGENGKVGTRVGAGRCSRAGLGWALGDLILASGLWAYVLAPLRIGSAGESYFAPTADPIRGSAKGRSTQSVNGPAR